LRVALDVWEPEPHINPELLEYVLLATPHIAGYSREGKIRGTEMLAEDYCQWRHRTAVEKTLGAGHHRATICGESLSQIILAAYDVADDDRRMREAMATVLVASQSDSVAERFDQLRKDYPQRHEFTHFSAEVPSAISDQAKLLGFV